MGKKEAWNKSHNLSYKIPEYAVWIALRQRCLNTKNPAYKNYGGRGIKVHFRWSKFEFFLKDVGRRPTKYRTIDRFPNNNGNYEPGNIRWATRKQQVENRRNALLYEIGGIKITLQEIADKYGVRYQTIIARINRGWDIKKVIETPIRHFLDKKTVSEIVKSNLGTIKASRFFGISKSEISYIRNREKNKHI